MNIINIGILAHVDAGKTTLTESLLYASGAISEPGSDETVVVQHIIAKGTIDERILSALSAKDRTQSALIAAVKAELKI